MPVMPPLLLVVISCVLLAATAFDACDTEEARGGCAAEAADSEASWLLQVQSPGPAARSPSSLVVGSNLTAWPAAGVLHRWADHATSLWKQGQVSALQLATSGRAAAKSLDWADSVVLLSSVIFVSIVIGFFALCMMQASLRDFGAGSADNVSECQSGRSAQSARPVSWALPTAEVTEDSMPTLCRKMVSNNRDKPIMVPLGPIKAGGAWAVNVVGVASRQKIFTARLLHDGEKKHDRSRVELWSFGARGQLLASIDSLLNIFYPDGAHFGKLHRVEESYMLEETNGREPRWSMGPEDDGTLAVVWLPKGTSRVPEQFAATERKRQVLAQLLGRGLEKLGKLVRRQSSRGPVIATVAQPHGSNDDRLELDSISGVDLVLVLLCTLGVIAFDQVMEKHEPHSHRGHLQGDKDAIYNNLPLGFASTSTEASDAPSSNSKAMFGA
ncbi:unnamed protein product [Polarella glacialis]|uniref:Anaphase-promoting complex subunit 1 n=1 Tax=Polarella glacialis TaxID=89957 RepID=A0A813INK1_POLGL|nr:unnamed protein product [Polarella glacialis]